MPGGQRAPGEAKVLSSRAAYAQRGSGGITPAGGTPARQRRRPSVPPRDPWCEQEEPALAPSPVIVRGERE